ncbi:hypothetical protein [Ekhidna sp.]|uniref:hypothetical protein n=1 Tax=Ekhidna sp. TaxID=2608089 RepID=UPI003C7E344A
MDKILLIKLLAIGITIFYIFRNNERTSNWIGGLLAASFGLTLFGSGALTSIAIILYTLTLVATLFLVLTGKIVNEQRTLFSVFLLLAIINSTPMLLNLPNYGIFYYLAIIGTLLYGYFQLKHRTVNILVVTSIPVISFILTLSELIN